MSQREINILHLYPDLLNLYGDKGNISALEKRLSWRGIHANITGCTQGNDHFDPSSADIIFLGGGSDREQEVVCQLLASKKDVLRQYVENNGVFLAFCGGLQMIGTSYATADKSVTGLGLLNIHTEISDSRLTGDVIVQSDLFSQPICGFENHAGRIQIQGYSPLGKVAQNHGNDGISQQEGVLYKNVIGANLSGPLLPRNPMLCDYILTCALKKKYPDFKQLAPLDDTMENKANDYIVKTFGAQ